MELFRALGALAEPPAQEHQRLAEMLELGRCPTRAEYDELFLFRLYPYASVYLGAEGMIGGEARDRIAGFWRALGQAPPAEVDQLTTMLASYAELHRMGEQQPDHVARWQHVQRAFLWEHLISWLPMFLIKVREIGSPFYVRWAELLAQSLAIEVGSPPAALPLHLREAQALADPRQEGGEPFLSSLLSPARSGIILVRNDLIALGDELHLATRVAERRYALRALLGQDPRAVLSGLARLASSWQQQHRKNAVWGVVSEHWRQRAAATADLLGDLAAETRDS